MKTRRNHRKTTTSRRRRRVVKQQRVQTRIHRRKGTAVSSRRRDYFFKRGGGKEDEVINTILQDILDDFKTEYAKLFSITNKDDVPLQFNTDNPNPPVKIITTNPIVKTRDGTTFMFRIVEPKEKSSDQSVYIYIPDSTGKYQLYKKIILVNNSATATDSEKYKGSYYRDVANIIFNALNALKP